MISNIGSMLPRALEGPVLDADTIVTEGDRIVATGKRADVDTADARTMIDAPGCAVSPGLIDSHVHPVCGRLDAAAATVRMDRFVPAWQGDDDGLGGEGASAGTAPGRRWRKGVGCGGSALRGRIPAGGVKVLAWAPVIGHGMVESDFFEVAGVRLLGEVGLGSVKAGYEAAQMVAGARKAGFRARSIPGAVRAGIGV
jgi:enamidase